jgi:hypothetical protein
MPIEIHIPPSLEQRLTSYLYLSDSTISKTQLPRVTATGNYNSVRKTQHINTVKQNTYTHIARNTLCLGLFVSFAYQP